MSQMGAYLKETVQRTNTSQVESRATTSSPETLLWPSRTAGSCKEEGICSTCPAQINRNGGAP